MGKNLPYEMLRVFPFIQNPSKYGIEHLLFNNYAFLCV